MFSYLRALAARFIGRRSDRLPPPPPEDPYAGVRQPSKRGPAGRTSDVALAEPEECPPAPDPGAYRGKLPR